VNVNVLDENYLASTERGPALLDPFPRNVSIYEKMKMSDATLMKFKNGDVFDRSAVFASQVQPKLVEHTTQVPNRIALNF